MFCVFLMLGNVSSIFRATEMTGTDTKCKQGANDGLRLEKISEYAVKAMYQQNNKNGLPKSKEHAGEPPESAHRKLDHAI